MKQGRKALRRGMTLAEVVVSSAAMAILVGSMASAIILASKALPDNGSGLDGMVNAGLVLEQLSSELQCAVTVSERCSEAITFAVPDRNANGKAESIRYAWSGTPGDPLTRRYNSGLAVTVLENVQDFEVSYVLQSVTTEEIGPPTESGEVPIAWRTTLTSSGSDRISSTYWVGQFFKADVGAVPVGSVSWDLTRVRIQARYESPTNDTLRVQIRAADANGKPTSTILAEKTIAEGLLPSSYNLVDTTFSTLNDLTPDVGLCLVLAQTTTSGYVGRVIFDNGGGEGRLTSANAGGTWNLASGKSLYFAVYGNVTLAGVPQDVTHDFVTGVRIIIRAGEGITERVDTSMHLLNVPEAT